MKVPSSKTWQLFLNKALRSSKYKIEPVVNLPREWHGISPKMAEPTMIKSTTLLDHNENETAYTTVLAAQDVPQAKPMTDFWRNKYEDDAAKNWNKFYQRNGDRFFKDRHWTLAECEELREALEEKNSSVVNILEIGCGVGNTIFPLLEEDLAKDKVYIVGVDCSNNAIDICKKHSLYDEKRCAVAVNDIVNEPLNTCNGAPFDFVTCLFVLSSIHPDKHQHVFQQMFDVMKPGSILYFRDYAKYDLAQLRFQPRSKLSDNFYVRQDETRSYFFTREELLHMAKTAGFEEVYAYYFKKEQKLNRTRFKMNEGDEKPVFVRRWLHCAFRKPAQKSV